MSDYIVHNIPDYEKDTFGDIYSHTAIESFEKTKAKVFIIHSGDDLTVPISTGYSLYYEKFKDNPRFKFRLFEDRGHGTVYYSKQGVEYTKDFYKKWNELLKTNPSEEVKINFINENINRDIWNDRINTELFDEIIDFYNKAI